MANYGPKCPWKPIVNNIESKNTMKRANQRTNCPKNIKSNTKVHNYLLDQHTYEFTRRSDIGTTTYQSGLRHNSTLNFNK